MNAREYYARELVSRADTPWSWGWLSNDQEGEMVKLFVERADDPNPPAVFLEVGDFKGEFRVSQEDWDWFRGKLLESEREDMMPRKRRSRCPYTLREHRNLRWFYEGRDEI